MDTQQTQEVIYNAATGERLGPLIRNGQQVLYTQAPPQGEATAESSFNAAAPVIIGGAVIGSVIGATAALLSGDTEGAIETVIETGDIGKEVLEADVTDFSEQVADHLTGDKLLGIENSNIDALNKVTDTISDIPKNFEANGDPIDKAVRGAAVLVDDSMLGEEAEAFLNDPNQTAEIFDNDTGLIKLNDEQVLITNKAGIEKFQESYTIDSYTDAQKEAFSDENSFRNRVLNGDEKEALSSDEKFKYVKADDNTLIKINLEAEKEFTAMHSSPNYIKQSALTNPELDEFTAGSEDISEYKQNGIAVKTSDEKTLLLDANEVQQLQGTKAGKFIEQATDGKINAVGKLAAENDANIGYSAAGGGAVGGTAAAGMYGVSKLMNRDVEQNTAPTTQVAYVQRQPLQEQSQYILQGSKI